jgi:glycine cleavage system H protein
MNNDVPSDLKYSASHDWAREEDDGTFTVGITNHAQDLLGDLVYVELPQIETTTHVGSEVAVVESAKAASDVMSPLSGEIIEVNEALTSSPGMVNSDPYGEGWLFRIKASQLDELDDLIDAEAYEQQIASEEH